MKTIEEGNKLIAEFVGAKLTKGNFYLLDGEILAHEADLKYHTSWDWLMPVVEKIESFDHISVDMTKGYCRVFKCYNFEDRYRHGNQLAFSSDTPKIQAVWSACVEFIDWFNNH